MRKIPLMEQFKILFNGKTTIIGAGVIGICLLFFLFTMESGSLKAIHFLGEEKPIMAKVTTVIPQDGKNRVLYQFTVDKKNYHGDFYTQENKYLSGSYIEVDYAKGNPKHSRLKGETTNVMVIATGIIFIIGVLLILLEFKQNVTMWILVNWGKLTRTSIVSKERGKNDAYVILFRYKDHKGDVYEHIEKTTNPSVYNNRISESILYLSKRPKMAVLVSKVPATITLYDI